MSDRVSLQLSSMDHQVTLLELIPSHFFIYHYKHIMYSTWAQAPMFVQLRLSSCRNMEVF